VSGSGGAARVTETGSVSGSYSLYIPVLRDFNLRFRRLKRYRIGKGRGEAGSFLKYRSTNDGETAPLLTLPEVKRLRFHSFIVTAEKGGSGIIFSDPLRGSGRIFYPLYSTRVTVSLTQ
jgi:hypothetical protein